MIKYVHFIVEGEVLKSKEYYSYRKELALKLHERYKDYSLAVTFDYPTTQQLIRLFRKVGKKLVMRQYIYKNIKSDVHADKVFVVDRIYNNRDDVVKSVYTEENFKDTLVVRLYNRVKSSVVYNVPHYEEIDLCTL